MSECKCEGCAVVRIAEARERGGLWTYGREHTWFAWRPVPTDCGWTWLRRVHRRRVHLGPSMPGAAEWWEYRR